MKVNILLNIIMDFVKMGWGLGVPGVGIRVRNYMINFAHATGCHCCTFGNILDGSLQVTICELYFCRVTVEGP